MKAMSPTHLLAQPSCPALNASTSPRSKNPAWPDSQDSGGGYFGTLSAIGELHLRLGGRNQDLLKGGDVSLWLRGISDLIEDTDSVLTNFPTLILKPESANKVLK